MKEVYIIARLTHRQTMMYVLWDGDMNGQVDFVNNPMEATLYKDEELALKALTLFVAKAEYYTILKTYTK